MSTSIGAISLSRFSDGRLCAAVMLVLAGCGSAAPDRAAAAHDCAESGSVSAAAETGPVPDWARRLTAAYPKHIRSIDGGTILFRDGTRMAVSDGKVGKSAAERPRTPDVDDMFAEPYVAGRPARPPRAGEDPGRTRYEPFFDRIYGDCSRGEVTPRMRDVAWMPDRKGGTVRVTTENGVADQLEKVVRDLKALPPAMTRYLVPSAGTYNCRTIAGTGQRSMHAYGIAIDIATPMADYWRWGGGKGAAYRNRIPFEIVEIFERHGFIWGGKWSHFDTMHFEYRPELLPPARGG